MVARPDSLHDDLQVLVVGDDPLARHGLSMLLAGEPGVLVAGQTAPSIDLAQTSRQVAADVVAWDLGVDPAAGLDRFRDTHEAGLPAVVLSAGPSLAADAWAAGARGALPRDSDGPRLAAALRACALGLVVFDERLAESFVTASLRHAPTSDALSPRELEVLQLLAQGLPNKLIADRLGISDHTAKFHVNAILTKLGASSRTEAVVRGARLGLVAL